MEHSLQMWREEHRLQDLSINKSGGQTHENRERKDRPTDQL
jgi:hypothetical protein